MEVLATGLTAVAAELRQVGLPPAPGTNQRTVLNDVTVRADATVKQIAAVRA